ncbi:hypothetical protein BGZ57DRAFT_925181 [Hyaloscypha finlandica]|nr:hypothetical protein BGZ57DRAFT_925181 [Hyaloscypha finlandica]
MKPTLGLVAALLGAVLTGATPLEHVGMIYDVEFEEAALVPRKAEHVARDLDVQDVQYVDKAQACIIDIYRAGNPAGTPQAIGSCHRQHKFRFHIFPFSIFTKRGSRSGHNNSIFPKFGHSDGSGGYCLSIYDKTGHRYHARSNPRRESLLSDIQRRRHLQYNRMGWSNGSFPRRNRRLRGIPSIMSIDAHLPKLPSVFRPGYGNLYTVNAGGTFNGTKTSTWASTFLFSFMIKLAHGEYLRDAINKPPLLPLRQSSSPQLPAPKTAAAPVRPTTIARKSPTITTIVYVMYIPPSSPLSVGPGGKRDVEEQAE